MKKPAELRRHLQQWVPVLAKHPDKLHLLIDKGTIASRYGKSLSFRYDYTVQIVITDFAESTDVLVVPLLIWIAEHQPNLLLDPEQVNKVLQFEAELLNHDKVDLGITLPLSERVIVNPAGSGFSCEHLGEPPLPDLSGPRNWAIYLKGEPIAGGAA